MTIVERSKRSHASEHVLERTPRTERVAAGPISWGVCEVPGWGVMLPADRVLAEMAALGIAGTELGAPGFLPTDATELRDLLERHGLELAGAFVPLVLHDRDGRSATLDAARRTADLLAATGTGVFVSTAVVDAAWAARFPLSPAEWQHLFAMLAELDALCAERGVRHAFAPAHRHARRDAR